MKRAFSPLLKPLIIAAIAFAAASGYAEEKAPAHNTAPKVDPAKGGTLYAEGDAARGLPACVSCHGAGGNSSIAINPKLSAQSQRSEERRVGKECPV